MSLRVRLLAALFVGGAVLAVGLARWVMGRRLLKGSDPALIAERWLEINRRTMFLGVLAGVVAFGVLGFYGLLALPLVVLSLSIGAYPSRRAVLGESWQLRGYLAHVGRIAVGFYFYGIALMATPLLVFASGSWWIVAGMAGAAVLAVLRFNYYTFLTGILRARTFDDPVVTRFREVVSASKTTMPRLFRAGSSDGRWANAFALPSVKTPGVLFTETLLSELDPEELVAIFCHELAHLEYFDAKRSRFILRVELAMIGVLAIGLPALARIAHWGQLGVLIGTCVVFCGWAWWRATGTQRRETESDTRALALCGNAEALISGLTKVYVLHRLPRRWSAETERRSSHPSLARRIQHIRGLAPEAVAAPRFTASVAAMSTTGDSAVVFDHDRFHLVYAIPEGVPADLDSLRQHAGHLRSLTYSELIELRVRTARGGPSVVATTRSGERWSVPIHAGDAGQVQQALDRIDGRLASPHLPRTSPTLLRLVAVATMIAAYALGEWPLALVGLVALLVPGSATLLALAVAAVVSALLGWRDFATVPGWRASVEVGALGGCGILCAAASLRGWDASRHRERINIALAVLAAASAISWCVLLIAMTGGLYLAHQSARSHITIVLPLATAAVLGALGGRLRRWGASFAVLTVIPLLLGSELFAARIIHDPLLTGAEIAFRRASLREVDRAPLAISVNRVMFSPSGRRFVARTESDDEGGTSLFADGEFGRPESDQFTADAVTFAGEDRLLIVTGQPDQLRARLTRFPTEAGDEWSIELPRLALPVVQFDERTQTWFVAGTDKARFRRFTGTLSGDRTDETVWELPEKGTGSFIRWHVGRGPHALAVERWARRSPLSVLSLWPMEWIYKTILWRVGRGTRERLLDSNANVECADEADLAGRFVCSAAVTGGTFYWSIDPVSGTRRSFGAVHGEFWGTHLSQAAVSGYLPSKGPMVVLLGLPEPAGLTLGWDAGWVSGVDRFNRIVTGSGDDSNVLRRFSVDQASRRPRR